jgi:hypothetical protein
MIGSSVMLPKTRLRQAGGGHDASFRRRWTAQLI